MSTVLISLLVVAGICILLAIGYINHIVENNRLEKARLKADLSDRLRRCENLSEGLPGQMMSPALKALLCRLQLHHCQNLLALDRHNAVLKQRSVQLQAELGKKEAITVANAPLKISSEAIAKDIRFQLEGLDAQIVHAAQKRLLSNEEARQWSNEIRHLLVLANIELFTSLGQTALQQSHAGQARLAFERGVQYLRKLPDHSRYQQALQLLEAQLERANALVLHADPGQAPASELTEGLKELDGEDEWMKKTVYD